jgi:hypothetical protein
MRTVLMGVRPWKVRNSRYYVVPSQAYVVFVALALA